MEQMMNDQYTARRIEDEQRVNDIKREREEYRAKLETVWHQLNEIREEAGDSDLYIAAQISSVMDSIK